MSGGSPQESPASASKVKNTSEKYTTLKGTPSVVIVLFECVSVAECGLGMLVCCVEEE